MKPIYRNGDKVIIIKEPSTFGTEHIRINVIGKVVTIDEYRLKMGRYKIKGFKWLTVSESEITPVVRFEYVDNLLNDRDLTKDTFALKSFILGIFTFLFLTIGTWFISESDGSMWFVNEVTGSLSLGFGLFCVYIIREDYKKLKKYKREFSNKIFFARQDDLIDILITGKVVALLRKLAI